MREMVPLVLILLIGLSAPAGPADSSAARLVYSTKVVVFSDGTAEVNQTFSPMGLSAVTLPLLSAQVGNIVAVSGNGTAVSYELMGANITFSTFGVSKATFVYDTDALTTKQGSTWSLRFDSPYNLTVVLPFQSTVLSLSKAAQSYSVVRGTPILSLGPGAWEISYGLALFTQLTTTIQNTVKTSSGSGVIQPSVSSSAFSQDAGIAIIVVAAAASGAAVYVARSRSSLGGKELRSEDRDVLNFIRERGGTVSEVEIRLRFELPRTSAWRQAKRLENLGLVKITKVGKQNHIVITDGQPESR